MKQLTSILRQFKQWILSIVIGRFWKGLMKDIPQRCPKCGGKIKMKGIDFIGMVEYNVYGCVDCNTEYV